MSSLKRMVKYTERFANRALKTTFLDDLEPQVCGLIVLAEKAARSPGAWLLRCELTTKAQQFSRQDMVDIAQLPRSADLFWSCVQTLVQSYDDTERQCAASTILNLQNVKWRRSQRAKSASKRRTDLN